MTKPRRKPPPVTSRPPRRKGNHPSNPYATEAAAAPRLEDREGWPFAAPRAKADLSDEAQLGRAPPPLPPPSQPNRCIIYERGEEPTFTLRARDPMFGMIVRFWANANEKALCPEAFRIAQDLATRGDAWREKNSGAG